MKLEKMKKTAGILYTITNIIRILVIIAFVVVAVAAGVIFFIPGTVIPEGIITTSVSLGDVTVHLAEGAAVGTMDKSRFSIILAFAAVILLLTLYGLRMVKQILKPMKEGRPFDESIGQPAQAGTCRFGQRDRLLCPCVSVPGCHAGRDRL